MIINERFNTILNAPYRALAGRVEFYNGSTLALMCGCHDRLVSFTVERLGGNKFFGFGVCNKINVKLLDRERALNITTANTIEVVFGAGSDFIYPFSKFYVTEVHRNENDNTLSITAYDSLYEASKHKVNELVLPTEYTIRSFVEACASLLGLPLNELGSEFDRIYSTGANFEGTETIREALNAVAEATQTIYFVNWDWKLTFKSLAPADAAVFTIDREKYISLDSGDNRRLSIITHTTELGDNISASTGLTGSTQYIRENPFIALRDDAGDILQAAIAKVGGLTINNFDCQWRGNFLLEIGDKLELITKDNKSIYSYLLNDSISFNGSLSQHTLWNFDTTEIETESNPASLGDVLKQTYARVDKANRQIELAVNDISSNKENISNLQLTTDGISATVQRVEENTIKEISGLHDSVSSLTNTVEAKVSAQDVQLQIKTELANGVDKVTTATGFTFNEEGLTVSKTGSEMTTTITEDGMVVYKDNAAVLTANNIGVDAVNLHATTYLIIGTNSRLEDYGGRTGCFWIGGYS